MAEHYGRKVYQVLLKEFVRDSILHARRQGVSSVRRLPAARRGDRGRDRRAEGGTLRPQSLSSPLEGVRERQHPARPQQGPYRALMGRAPAPAVDARRGLPDARRRDLASRWGSGRGDRPVQEAVTERAGSHHRVLEVVVSYRTRTARPTAL